MATQAVLKPGADTQEVTKPVHTILLDTSPILLNTPSISTLLANSNNLVTTPAVLAEIKGEEARNRLETLYKPFLQIRSANPQSITLVREFARKTGDSGVLSSTDIEVIALAYDLECERNGGDWRLRKVPGQKRLNGSPPTIKGSEQTEETVPDTTDNHNAGQTQELGIVEDLAAVSLGNSEVHDEEVVASSTSDHTTPTNHAASEKDPEVDLPVEDQSTQENLNSELEESSEPTPDTRSIDAAGEDQTLSDSDEGWITPSNIKRHQAKDDATSSATRSETRILQVATMTGDFAMQNVLLQMNLNLLSTKTCKRVAHIKQMILRCHGCFNTTKDMSKQFCPRCGKPTLTRVTCTTDDKGEVKLHLKANHQWNNRGNVFSVPKPTSGTANQKWKGPRQGGGQGGWGNNLILTEDQKEYTRAMANSRRTKQKDLMDEDMLPSIITGDRDRAGGRTRVGAGRNVNSRKR